MIPFSIQAKILSQALPYFQKFRQKKMVVKIGGSVLAEKNIDQELIKDIVLMKLVGISPIVVHGGGNHITQVMKRFKKESKFIDGLRVTDPETLEITQMVLGGIVNQKVVSLIQHYGGKAIGLSGKDGAMIVARKFKKKVDLGLVGEIIKINSDLLNHLENTDYIPVISPLGVDKTHSITYNINADSVATSIATSLKVEKLIFISDQEGVLRDVKNPASLINQLNIKEIEKLKKEKNVFQGMLPKLDAAKMALKNKVNSVHFISGKIKNSLLMELFTDAGIGTKISR